MTISRDSTFVFLSYASRDRERALALADQLEAAGVPVWVDRRAIAGGSSWNAEIVRGIEDCAAFVLLTTNAAVRSRNVQRELQLAVEFDRPVLPVRLEPVEYPTEMRYALAGVQWVDLVDRSAEAWQPEMLRALAVMGVTSPESVPDGAAAASMADAGGAAAATTRKSNLPVILTSFIGREREIEDVMSLLSTARLVTLTGPGGSGKTRLALAVAEAVQMQFPDGTFFVDLAPLADPHLVVSAIAQALGVTDIAGQSLMDSLTAHLGARRVLLVLDNFERVVAAAPAVTTLLAACPRLTVLVTSRVVLHVSGEKEFAVPPLGLPDLAALPTPDRLVTYSAVALFTARACDASPAFTVTAENAVAVAEICARLDGLPLAIELAAARIKLLPPSALLPRLDRRLPLLVGGPRDVPARQQTLRDTIAWSHDLLDDAHQRLFRRLSVFAGGVALEMAEAVADAEGDLGLFVLDGLGSLVDHSLLRRVDGPDGEPRFTMWETIREYGWDQLVTHAEADALRRHHAHAFLALAEAAEPYLVSGRRMPWMRRLGAEQDNLRAALRWSVECGEPDAGLRILGALMYWYFIAFSEGLRWSEELLALPAAAAPTAARAKALSTAALMAWSIGDYEANRAYGEESVMISRTLDQPELLARSLSLLGAGMVDDPARGYAAFAECIRLYEQAGNAWGVAWGTICHGALAATVGDVAVARVKCGEARERFRALSDDWLVTAATFYLGAIALQSGEHPAARTYFQECLAGMAGPGEVKLANTARIGLALIACWEGDTQEAARRYAEALVICRETGDVGNVPLCLEGLAAMADGRGDGTHAARLLGAAKAIHEAGHRAQLPLFEPLYQGTAASVAGALGEQAFGEAAAIGHALALDQAITAALALEQSEHAVIGRT